ncbi:MAG: flavodoxin-dependent (E)-4-hydroxy-3-methylbut-2-enyl-diphosphate synthase [Proteobacteria bacterium]|nr:flavodoxin-dependent (E)-4-hydroxy-3-methylbut-2-enyl-diphosphate synthase [Pseudomonadota bacterium]
MNLTPSARASSRVERRPSRAVWIGGVKVGGGAPVAVDGWAPFDPDRPDAISAVVRTVQALEAGGAGLVSLPCASVHVARRLADIVPACPVPLLADIDGGSPAVAAAAAESGARGLWLAPGDYDDAGLQEIAAVALDFDCALGLVLREPVAEHGTTALSAPVAFAQAAAREGRRLEALGCRDILIALRVNDPVLTVAAVRALARTCDWPIALAPGPSTPSGPPSVSSALAIGLPLTSGIGDLVWLPPAADPVAEVRAAVIAVKSLGLRPQGVSVAADGGFLRARRDADRIIAALEDRLAHVVHSTIAVTLSAEPSTDQKELSAELEEPAPGSGSMAATYRLRIACTAGRHLTADELVEDLAALVEDAAAAIHARHLHHLVDDLRRRHDIPASRGPASPLWIEAAVALYTIFRGRPAKIVWGSATGAAAYQHLTGRRLPWQVPRSRTRGDTEGADRTAGATAVSIALGLAIAAQQSNVTEDVIAVINPSALESGATLEAIRAARSQRSRLLIVLLDPAQAGEGLTASLAAQFSRLVSSRPYFTIRDLGKQIVRNLPGPGYAFAKRLEEFARGIATGGQYFEELGVYYVGPISGRRFDQLLPVLRNLCDTPRDHPALVHVVGSAGSAKDTETLPVENALRDELVKSLVAAVKADPRVVVILQGSGVVAAAFSAVERAFPTRCVRASEAERHGLGFARGLAAGGVRPLVLLDRRSFWLGAGETAREWMRLRLPLTLLVDLAEGQADEPWLDAPPLDLTAVPGFVVMLAADARDLPKMLKTAHEVGDQPVLIGYQSIKLPSLAGVGETVEIGRGRVVRRGRDVAIIAVGRGVQMAVTAAEALVEKGVEVTVADAVFAQPFDTQLLSNLFREHRALLVVDDPGMAAGIGGIVLQSLSAEIENARAARIRGVRVGKRAVRDLVAAAMELCGRTKDG